MACQKVDTGEVLGTGQTHILSSTWLETYDTNFQNLHENAKKYLKQEEGKKKDNVVTATFHFLNPGRSLPQGLESGNSGEILIGRNNLFNFHMDNFFNYHI